MDNLFYTYSSNNRNDIVAQSQNKNESLIFSLTYHSIFVNGEEFGSKVTGEPEHYKEYAYTISYGTGVNTIIINGDGSETESVIPGMVNFSEKGHFVSGVNIPFKHGPAGNANTDNTYGSSISDIEITTDGNLTNNSIVGKIEGDDNGHIKSGKNIKIKHGLPSTVSTTYSYGDINTETEIEIPAGDQQVSSKKVIGYIKGDNTGHISSGKAINLKHGTPTITDEDKNKVILSYGTNFTYQTITYYNTGHIKKRINQKIISYSPTCEDGSIQKIKSMSISDYNNLAIKDANTIYFLT